MRVHIFDVEHGECSAIETPSGHLILIGLGHNSTTGWRPSSWVRQRNQRPSLVVLTNLDRDHVSDIENFEPHLRPDSLMSNQQIDPGWLKNLKIAESGQVDPAIDTALAWVSNVYTGGPFVRDYGMEIQYFYNSPGHFQDTNNLSVVTFVKYRQCGILFPGDLETAGWKALLSNPAFVTCLSQTNLLVASHHGRAGGYCAEIFGYCRLEAVVISDKAVVHDTQDHNLYGPHCSGITFPGGEVRRVLTTRMDGKITVEVPLIGGATVSLANSAPPPLIPGLFGIPQARLVRPARKAG